MKMRSIAIIDRIRVVDRFIIRRNGHSHPLILNTWSNN